MLYFADCWVRFWTVVINGFLAPPLLVLILIVSNNPKVMGQRGNGSMLNIACGITAIVMSVAVLGLLATWGH